MANLSTKASTVRIGLAGAVAVAVASAAAIGGAATGATYKPYLYISSLPAGSVKFEVRLAATDLPTYTAEIRVPYEYGATLDQPLGTVVGRVAATTLDQGASLPYTGALTVAKPDPNNGCFSLADDDTAWNVNLTNGTQVFAYQIYVRLHAGDVTLLRYCLPPNAGVLDSVGYTITGVFAEPAHGNYAWRGQFYPYTATGEVVDNAAGVGAAALVRLPHIVALRASYSKRSHRYVLRGSVTESGVDIGHASVRLFIGTRNHALRSFARATTDKSGSFSYSGKLSAKHPVEFKATARAAPRVISPPNCAALNGWPCLTQTVSSWANDSRTIAIRP
jgi:hypothetical protein